VTIFGGSAQFVVQGLIDWTGDPLMPAWYQIAANIVSLTAILLITAHPSEREVLEKAGRK
jgi:hypothetical protein